MNTIKHYSCRMALILLGLAYAIPVFSQNAYEKTTDAGPVKVTLSLDKKEIISGEPVTLGIKLENTGVAPTEVVSRFFLAEGNDLKVEVQPPAELSYRYQGPLDQGTFPVNAIRLLPGAPVHWSTVLQARPEAESGLVFDQPGTYRVNVSFTFSHDISNEQVVADLSGLINVKPPDGKNAEAFKLLATPSVARAVHLGVIRDDSVRDKLKELADTYGDSVYGRGAIKALGLSATYGDKPDYKEAVSRLSTYLRKDPDAPAADWVAYSLAAAYHFQKDYEAAREAIFFLRERYPSTVYIIPQDPLLQYYFYKPAAATTQIPWLASANRFVAPGTVPPTDLKPIPQ